ncbi:uncharacterized protein LOC110664552 [Hevea brasiliensis]|uniref:uncharacterized protein LOC110664552 n=1 Tax=Hevea brasiliensis TaxID=3981 RepID=UPI0025F381E2|nr:uncharacterized protein LOC110664552 [Hevea brasiliensis]
MPSYAKFFKDTLSKKKRLEDYETVALTEKCSAILQNKLPPKLKDPGSFSIPCLVGDMNIDKALCDLGASVSLMPLSIFKKLDVGELKPTTISLQLADQSMKYLVGILENIPIKVGKFFIPVDFVILEMEEDVQIPIILGEIIDIKNGLLTLKVGDEKVEFNLFSAMKHKLEPDECFRVNIIDKQVEEEFHKAHMKDPLETCIVHSHTANNENTKITACAKSLVDNPPLSMAQTFKVEELKEEQPKGKLRENTKQVELKPLPSTLRYAFLDSNSEYPVIINASLSDIEEEKLLRMLGTHRKANVIADALSRKTIVSLKVSPLSMVHELRALYASLEVDDEG